MPLPPPKEARVEFRKKLDTDKAMNRIKKFMKRSKATILKSTLVKNK
jgi:hypothetical protein